MTLYFTIIIIKGWFIVLFDNLNFFIFDFTNQSYCLQVTYLSSEKSKMTMYILFGRPVPPNSPKVTCNRSILSIFIAHYFLQVILICGINCGQTILLTGSMYIKLSFFPECPLADASINSYRKNYINTLKYFRNKYKSFFVSNFDEKNNENKIKNRY